MLFLLQFLARIFEIGAFVTFFFVIAALLESDVVIGWAGQVRRFITRRT
jgi:hypothetical protein